MTLVYILNLIYKFRMTKLKPVCTPLDENLKLDAASETEGCEPTQYHQLIRN